MLWLQKRFREFQSSAPSAGCDGVLPAEHAEEVGLHERSGHIYIAAHIEGIAGFHGLAFIHAVHGARKGHASFHEAILGHQRGSACGLIRKQFIREQPIEDVPVAWLCFACAPARHRIAEPCGDAAPGFSGGVWLCAGVERGKGVEFILRCASRVMRDDAGDAEPASFVIAEVVIFEPLRHTGARREVGVQR